MNIHCRVPIYATARVCAEYIAGERRQPGLQPPAGEVLIELHDSNAERERQNKLSWRGESRAYSQHSHSRYPV
jgi:hypothetical protein